MGTYGSLTWNIPKNLSLKNQKEWIKCFFDCEAHVNIAKKQIQLKSVNYDGLTILKKLLENQKILPKLYGPYVQKGENHNPYGFLIILGKENLLKYYKKIGFYHSHKIKSLNNLIKTLNL